MISGGYNRNATEMPLHPYQVTAIEWLLNRLYAEDEQGAGLFLDPGLGKTRITWALMNALFELDTIKRALVVAPLRPVYLVWPDERKLWGFPQRDIILHNQYRTALSYGLQVEYVNFEGLAKLEDIRDRWDLIVVDESTFVKNWSTKRSKRLRKMIKSIRKRIILTGTPASNSLTDLFAQVYLLDNGESLGKNITTFRARFCTQGGWKGRKWIVRQGMGGDIQDAIKHLVLRMEAEDHLDMPDLIFNNVWTSLPANAYNQYKRLKRELYAELETGDVFAATASSAYGKCKQFANGQVYATKDDGTRESHVSHNEKLHALFELHEELGGKPLMVCYYYNHDAERIKNAKGSPFKDAPILRGNKWMKAGESDRIIGGWNDGNYHAILCQWDAVSHGLNMQKSNCADFACFGIPDSLDKFEQAYRRVYRQGNEARKIRVHRLLTRGTVEEVQLERLEGKHATQSSFLTALKQHAKG